LIAANEFRSEALRVVCSLSISRSGGITHAQEHRGLL
jgi:hypothetical protein